MLPLTLALCLAPALLRSPDAVPCDTCLPGIVNFAKLDGSLWRGGQPSAEGFRALEAAGAKTVVSLRHDHDDLPLLKGTRLRYLRIPSRAWDPEEAQLLRFLKVVQDPANRPVFVHCQQGRDRTGYTVAAYRMVLQGWSAEEALAEMRRFRFNRIWIGNPGFLKRLDAGALRQRLETTAAPALLDP